MPTEWRRDKASRKGLRLHLSGLSQSGDPVGILHGFDSHGKLKRLNTGCPAIEIDVMCTGFCSNCEIFPTIEPFQFPPGTLVFDPITTIQTCCE